MYCTNCGERVDDGKFCPYCGYSLDSYYVATSSIDNAHFIRKSGKYKPIIFVVIGIILFVSVILIFRITPEKLKKKLAAETWYSEEEKSTYNDSGDFYSEYNIDITYWEYQFRLDGEVEMTCYEECYRSYDSFDFDEYDYSYWDYDEWDKEEEWKILDDKSLKIDDVYYKWDSYADENTWYLSGNTLRIGESEYKTYK